MLNPADQPLIGVVVIGRNEGERLRRCLESVVAPGRQVVYVDSGSLDGSPELASSLGADVVALDMSRPFSASRARNAGLQRLLEIAPATDLVQFVDGDCQVSSSWLATAAAALNAEPTTAAVCGRLRELHPDASLYNRLCDIEWNAPPGLVRACGGIAMYRVSALTNQGGFNQDVIAGEEPELCYRLRRAGHAIRRLPDEMALHDADMHSFGQWWRRAARGGWAMAHGAALHGRGPERFNVRRIVSVLLWALLLPAAWLAWLAAGLPMAMVLLPGSVWLWCALASAVVPALYAALLLRIASTHRARPHGAIAFTIALFTIIAKFAELTGLLRFFFRRRSRPAHAAPRFEKRAAVPERPRALNNAPGESLLYISSILPARSETFVYREVFALRARGITVRTASVNAPEPALGEPRLDALAAEAIPVYAAGPIAFLRDLTLETLRHPADSARTMLRATADILTCDDVPWPRRPRLAAQALAALALARRVRPLGITHIHAHMAHVPTSIAMVAAHQLAIPFSFTGHANDIFPNRALLRTKLRRAAFVSCISCWHQRFYHELAGVPLDRLPVIRCGVDVPAADRATPGPRSHAAPSTDATPVLRILAVGRLIKKKGFDVLLDAVGAMAQRRPDLAPSIELTIVGDGPEMASLVAQACSLCPTAQPSPDSPHPTVELLGALPNPRVRELMRTADLFVLPCRIDPAGDRDGIPVVLMEAMAAGVPVISGRLPAIEELVDHETTGLMVPPGDAAALADALERLLTDHALRARLADAGRRRVIDEFSEPVNIARLLHALGLHEAQRASDPRPPVPDAAPSGGARGAGPRGASGPQPPGPPSTPRAKLAPAKV